MEYVKIGSVLLFLFLRQLVWAQPESISVSGKVTDCKGRCGVYQAIVLNRRTSAGMMVGTDGKFVIHALKIDTIEVNAPGFIMKKICFHDSAVKSNYEIQIRLDSVHIELKEVEIYPFRNLTEIKEEERTLGVIPNTDLCKKADTSNVLLQILTLSIDIDGLYEKWSHREREKRKVAKLEDLELKRSILKDLLKLYRMKNLIDIEDSLMDKFIDYCAFSDDFIKKSADYDLEKAITDKYAEYKKIQDYASSYTR